MDQLHLDSERHLSSGERGREDAQHRQYCPGCAATPRIGARILPWLVLGVSLALTAIGWSITRDVAKQQARQQFDAVVRETSAAVVERVRAIEETLHATRGLLRASKQITRDQWLAFQAAQRFDSNHGGTLGVGLAVVVRLAEVERHVRTIRAADGTDYRIWPPGERPVYAPLRYSASKNKDTKAFGYDMYSEPTRRLAMERARDTGAAALSDVVQLVQAGSQTNRRSIILFLPVYSGALPEAASLEMRRAALTGYVECPVLIPDFLAHLANHLDGKKIAVRISDTDGNVLFATSTAAPPAHDALLSATERKQLYGQTWLAQFDALPGFAGTANEIAGTLVGLGGLIISLLLFATVSAITAMRLRAEALARQMTEELRTSEGRFRALTALSADWYWEQDRELRFTDLSGGVYGKAGHTVQSSLGKTRSELSGIELSAEQWQAHQALLDARKPFYDLTYRRITPEGDVRWLSVSGEPFFSEDGQFAGYRGIGKDVTQAVISEQRILRLNALYGALSATNESIAHTKDRDTLFREVCRILVEHGGIAMAWMGHLDTAQGHVHMLASFGPAEHYLGGYAFCLDPARPEGRGYLPIAIATRQVQVAHDLRNDQRIAAWRERSQKSQFLSKAIVPIVEHGEVTFSLQLYSFHVGWDPLESTCRHASLSIL